MTRTVDDRIVKAPIIVTREDDPKQPVEDPEGITRENVCDKYSYWIQAAVQRWREHYKTYAFTYGGWGSRTGIRFPAPKLLDYAGHEDELRDSNNPVAQIVLAHLEARGTRNTPEERRDSKVRLVKGLYERGWSADDVRQLFRLIDWLMELPVELQEGFRQDLHEFEEARHMPYVTSVERLAKKEGARTELLRTIAAGLKKKFGAAGTRLMVRIREIDEIGRLRVLADALIEVESLDDFRNLLKA